jgi:N,N'-diacetyllegionaminate synthase
MNKTLIIAEAGVNHNGDMSLAKKLIDAAKDAGADYVKFQTFKSSKLVSTTAPTADYQKRNIGDRAQNQFEMLQKLELSEQNHYELINYCNRKGIKFLSTAFDTDSLIFLKKLGISLFKIPSGELTNLPYLEKTALIADSIILSTGMSTLDEIRETISVLKGITDAKITVLHCNTEYPTPYQDVNLLAMITIKNEFNVAVGYSDHTLGIQVPIAAVALGATIIEKHFTLDRTMHGPDHAASLEPEELKEMVTSIRIVEKALGLNIKKPTPSELKNIAIARKSIYLAVSKLKGDTIKEEDLEMLRPGNGISPMKMREIIGKTTKVDLQKGHKLSIDDINI